MSRTTEVTTALLEHLHKLEGEQLKGDLDPAICSDILERKAGLYEELTKEREAEFYKELTGSGKGLKALFPGEEELEEAAKGLEVDAQ